MDDEVRDEFMALHRANGTFYLQERRQPLLRFLEHILIGKQKVFHERGAKALPRLLKKAFASRPIMAVFGFGGSILFGLLILWYCSCGLRRTILGLDDFELFPKRRRAQRYSSENEPNEQSQEANDERETVQNDEVVILEKKNTNEQEEMRTRTRAKKNKKNKPKSSDTQQVIVESTDTVNHDKQE